MGGKRTGRCSFLRRLLGLVNGESFDPEYRIKFLDEVGRLENLDAQDRKMFKRGDLISAHRDKTQELKKMQTKLSAIQHWLVILKEEYDTIQSSCDLCLSDDLDDLVETTINAYDNKFGDGPSSADNVIDMLADIMEFSQAFNFTSPNLIPPQLTKEFKGQSNDVIMDKLIALDKQIMQTTEGLRLAEEKMKLLKRTFASSQSDFFCIRYRKYRKVIEEVTRDVTADSAKRTKTGKAVPGGAVVVDGVPTKSSGVGDGAALKAPGVVDSAAVKSKGGGDSAA